MKNLLAITLVFILSLFVVEESRGEVKRTILKCEVTYIEEEYKEVDITDFFMNYGTGDIYARYYLDLIHQDRDRLLGLGVVAYSSNDGMIDHDNDSLDEYILLKESADAKYYYFDAEGESGGGMW